MDIKTLESLRVGDTVRIHFTHRAADPTTPRGQPFDVVITGFHGTGRAYKEDDGQYHESRQILWNWREMPEELQPDECVRDDIRGTDGCHVDHIVELVERGPYRTQMQPRNALYHAEQSAFANHQKVEAYRNAKGDRHPMLIPHRRQTATGYIFYAYNETYSDETYSRKIPKGQYNGHVFKFAQALIARRPAVVVPGSLDVDRFYAAWNQAGRPGYVGPFVEQWRSYIWGDEEERETKARPYQALLNRKAFTRWVVRNIHRFLMSEATKLANMIEAARIDEEISIEMMNRDFEDEHGIRSDDDLEIEEEEQLVVEPERESDGHYTKNEMAQTSYSNRKVRLVDGKLETEI